MSCVVTIRHNDNIIIGADSASVKVDWIETRKITTPKIFVVGEFVMGFTGSFRVAQVIQHCFTPPPIPKNDNIHRYFVADFVPVLKDTLKFHGAQGTEHGVEYLDNSTILLAYGSHTFLVGSDYQVSSYVDEYNAIGIGWQYAFGSFYATREAQDKPLERAIAALETAAYFNAGVVPPFRFYITGPDMISNEIVVDEHGNVEGLSSSKSKRPAKSGKQKR